MNEQQQKAFDKMKEGILAVVREGDARLADSQAKLQLSRSAIRTTIDTLAEMPFSTRPNWLIGYLLGVLESLK